MNSENRKTEKNFAIYFDKALEKSNLNLAKLSEKTGISRQHITLIKKTGSIPSSKLLRNIFQCFQEAGVEDSILYSLVFSALDILDKDSEAICQNLPLVFDYQPKDKEIKSRCIWTDILGESLDDNILKTTLDDLHKGIIYYYFLPQGSGDWQEMIDRAAAIDPENEQLVRQKTYCIKCPSYIIYSRIRIDNITSSNPEAYVSLGPSDLPSLRRLPSENAFQIISLTKSIVWKAERAKSSRQSTIAYRSENMELTFKLEDKTII